jgi:hypothetical protein
VDIDGAAQAVEVKEGVAFVALGPSGLLLADVSNPDAPAVLARAPTGGTAVQVAVSGGRHAFVANWSDARVFDVSDPKRPVLVATERIVTGAFSRVLGIGARGDFAFLGEWTGLYSYELHPNRKAPDLVLSENALEFGRVAKGKTRARVIIAENGGTAPLVSWSLVTSGEGFSVDRSSFVLAPGERKALEVTYRADSDELVTGGLQIASDDPDEPVRAVALAAGRAGAGVGDPAPEVEVALLGGGTWRSADHRGSVRVLAYFATF